MDRSLVEHPERTAADRDPVMKLRRERQVVFDCIGNNSLIIRRRQGTPDSRNKNNMFGQRKSITYEVIAPITDGYKTYRVVLGFAEYGHTLMQMCAIEEADHFYKLRAITKRCTSLVPSYILQIRTSR